MITLNYKQYGSGSNTLIILHGFLGSLDNWHTLATAWGNANYNVYALDMRNHGKSPHTAEHSIPLMVNDVKAFMEQHSLAHCNLLGHSMGGKVAMQFALTYPNMVSKLIVADIAPRAYKPGAHDDVFNALQHVDLTKMQTRKQIDEQMAVYLGDFGTRQFVMKGLERNDDNTYTWKFNISALAKNYPNILVELSEGTFTKPTLFLRGGQSLYLQDKDEVLIAKLFSHYSIATIANAGHWLHADKPKEVYDVVVDFIDEE